MKGRGKLMNQRGFTQLYWGFLFVMLNFRIQGFDILPDIVGYIFFAFGFAALASNSEHFKKASRLNIPMIILSIFSIYESSPRLGINVNFDSANALGILYIIS